MNKSLSKQTGFTIVELLVVIVVIGILAAITIVSFTGISSRAKIASLQSDLTSASQQLKLYQVAEASGNYPTANNCPTPGATEICLKASPNNTFTTYTPNNSANPKTFTLVATNGTTSYNITNDSAPIAGLPPPICATGYIVVPGSSTYGTSDFCVMKYEAKNVGGIATSQVALTPWTTISQTSAITTSVAACTGCHLITEAEWLTIAQNVLNVASNWDNGAGVHTVGTGYIYSGHNDSTPANAIEATTNDSDGYYLTGNVAPSTQKRTLTLSNGEVIWDLAGNVYEWTTGTVQSPTVQPGVTGGGYAMREWTAITNPGTVSPNPSPATTGIAGSGTWGSSYGIGRIYSNADYVASIGFRRGGCQGVGSIGGLLTLSLDWDPGSSSATVGFRVAK